ncbi:arabinogalactan O-methyltransferase 1-like [Malania oleifera]|uniref:arabinogalactan O-methyltransferase 1-like n=1 Tax=Malania oleifera TaxID=397392 RepID=UPI0025AEAC9C|nr:arabinogalactan O-methyltransferase 1-like [Malania oleifera]
MKKRHLLPEQPWLLGGALAGLFAGAVLIGAFLRSTDTPLFRSTVVAAHGGAGGAVAYSSAESVELVAAILHYATSRDVPQQSFQEITVTYDVLRAHRRCNFLVFGLGRDSLMWASFNPRGTTLFLEEDPKWVQSVLKDSPTQLRAHTVRYATKLSEADALLGAYRSEPACSAAKAYLKGNARCRLALSELPDEVYDTEWDLIMIDAPRGYFPEAPGRMGAIYSAAVMARARKGSGVTHVFLHDVDRRVEKVYAEEFLCRKYLVGAVGRLWHFRIPPAASNSSDAVFC